MPSLDRDYYLDKEGLRTLINVLETNIIADEYDSSVLYSVDQYCIYENSLYKCIAITSGTWDSSAWSKVIIGDELLSKANRMVMLSYGTSTWNDFLAAYKENKVVYCRASSNSNPATGAQNRLAFMAYINNADNPQNVEFQYYRSVSTKTESQPCDQVYIYTLTPNNTWTVTVRNAQVKTVTGNNLTSTFANNTITIDMTGTNVTNALGYTPTNIQTVTTAEWEALTPVQKASGDYVISDATFSPLSASLMPYDNTTSGLTADDVQEAIDEIASGVSYLRVVNGAVNIVYDDGT